MKLVEQVRKARRDRLMADELRLVYARDQIRDAGKTRHRVGDVRGQNLATTALLAVEDFLDHLEARR